MGDISEGGISFSSPSALEVSSGVEVELPLNGSRFELRGTVASCAQQSDGTYRVGLRFNSVEQSFRLKLAEQVLRIDELRTTLSRERGSEVTKAEAAQIWVERYASDFAALHATEKR